METSSHPSYSGGLWPINIDLSIFIFVYVYYVFYVTYFSSNILMQIYKVIAYGILTSTIVKLNVLYNRLSFQERLSSDPLVVILKLIVSCIMEHIVFIGPILLSVSSSPAEWKERVFNRRLLYALEFAEIAKFFSVFISVWDSEPIVLFILGSLILSLQGTSLQCIIPTQSVLNSFKILFIGVVCRFICRLIFHSLSETVALGLIL